MKFNELLFVVLLSSCGVQFGLTCQVSVKTDAHPQMPLLLNPSGAAGLYAFYLPNRRGILNFGASDIINLECPGGVITLGGVPTTLSNAPATCHGGRQFTCENRVVDFNQIGCSTPPTPTARYSGRTCLTHHREIEIGFMVSGNRFLTHLFICFDTRLQNTMYSYFILYAEIQGYQCCPRPFFIEDKFYTLGGDQLDSLYKQVRQRKTINSLLGLPPGDQTYIQHGNNYFLSRGHLTAKSDFIYTPLQQTTFYFVNIAPQWQSFNGGNWDTLEHNCRDFASTVGIDVDVYTGTHGIATLPHAQTDQQIDLYLYADKSLRAIPVPKYFWKVIYDSQTKKGISFIGINNPHQTVTAADIFCSDLCDKINWITISQNSIVDGYMFCCDFNDFRATVNSIPYLHVTGLLT